MRTLRGTMSVFVQSLFCEYEGEKGGGGRKPTEFEPSELSDHGMGRIHAREDAEFIRRNIIKSEESKLVQDFMRLFISKK